MNDRIRIPRQFWAGRSPAAMERIFDTGFLDEGECQTLWRMLGRKDTPPARFTVEVKAADVMRIWKATTPH